MPEDTPPLAGTDAERRRALALQTQLEQSGRAATVETFWCRPRWQLSQALHLILGIAGSLLSVTAPLPGVVLLTLALISLLSEVWYGFSPGGLLTGERASQNVIGEPAQRQSRVTLVITATYDASRQGALARVFKDAHGRWLGYLAVAMAVTLTTAVARLEGNHNPLVGVVQLITTVIMVAGTAILLEAAFSPAVEPGDGAQVAIDLLRALDVAPLVNADVELVLTGAGRDTGEGLRQYLRKRRKQQNVTNTVVLGIGDSSGSTRYLTTDGPLMPLRAYKQLQKLAADCELDASRGYGCSPALPARLRGLPSISLTGGAASDRVQAGVLLCDAIDVYLGKLPPPQPKGSGSKTKAAA